MHGAEHARTTATTCRRWPRRSPTAPGWSSCAPRTTRPASIVTAAEFVTFMASGARRRSSSCSTRHTPSSSTDPPPCTASRSSSAYPNLVVLRTFSKAYGLAGLRIGYAVGSGYILDAARATAIPLSVTEPAQRAALAALEHEPELLERVAHALRATRRPAGWRSIEPGLGRAEAAAATSSGCRPASRPTRGGDASCTTGSSRRRSARRHPRSRSARRSPSACCSMQRPRFSASLPVARRRRR